jgi:hypothetical protein
MRVRLIIISLYIYIYTGRLITLSYTLLYNNIMYVRTGAVINKLRRPFHYTRTR